MAVVFPSVGAAPWELRRGSTVQPLFAAPRSHREGSPFAGVREMTDRRLTILKMRLLKAELVLLFYAQGGGAQAPRSVDSLRSEERRVGKEC